MEERTLKRIDRSIQSEQRVKTIDQTHLSDSPVFRSGWLPRIGQRSLLFLILFDHRFHSFETEKESLLTVFTRQRFDLPVTLSYSCGVLFSSVEVVGRDKTRSARCFKWSSSCCFSSNKLIYFSFSEVCRELSDVSIPSLNTNYVNRVEKREACSTVVTFDCSSTGSVSSRDDGTFTSVWSSLASVES